MPRDKTSEMKVAITHSRLLTEQQFDSLKGSDIFASMIVNRVRVEIETQDRSELAQLYEKITNHLAETCNDFYYFLNRLTGTRHYYFLNRDDMDDFFVWSKVALSRNE